jgi:hypothetical protein
LIKQWWKAASLHAVLAQFVDLSKAHLVGHGPVSRNWPSECRNARALSVGPADDGKPRALFYRHVGANLCRSALSFPDANGLLVVQPAGVIALADNDGRPEPATGDQLRQTSNKNARWNMLKFLMTMMAVAILALTTTLSSAKQGWAKHGGWQSGKVYKHVPRGHHYGWSIGRGNPHRYSLR